MTCLNQGPDVTPGCRWAALNGAIPTRTQSKTVLLVALFSSAYWHVADAHKPAPEANMFPASALLAEASTDAALRA